MAAQERRASSSRATAASRTRSTGGALQVLGRACRRDLGRRRRPRRQRAQGVRARRHQDLLRDARALAHHRRRRHGARRAKRSTRASNVEIRAKAVVLACGGFESNAEMRARYLGPGWDLAKVRGTRYNTGLGHQDGARHRRDALRPLVGLPRRGLGPNAPPFGDVNVGDQFQKHSYPVGHHDQRQRRALRRRRRRLPQLHLRQIRPRDPRPARHVRVAGLRPEAHPHAARRIPHQAGDQGARQHARRARAEDGRRERRALPARDQGIQQGGAARQARSTWRSRTAAHRRASRSTRPTGRTRSTTPPFEAYARHLRRHVQLRRPQDHQQRRSARTRGQADPGLFAAGELVGGIFYHNYPGGTGLTSGAVFGKIAGTGAAAYIKG